jgi:phosphonate degradation associated HDIG domain protein
MALGLEQIIRLYRTAGAARYGMEAINQEQHALQCGLLAQQAGASAELVTAALLHDLGHLLAEQLDESPAARDDLHEYRPIPFLRGAFPDAVIEPIRLHVAAKRFLCVQEPGYWDGLSPASRHSLQLQGGPFSAEEAERFAAQPYAMDAIALRRWDEQAKSPTRATPGWEHFRPAMQAASLRRDRVAA